MIHEYDDGGAEGGGSFETEDVTNNLVIDVWRWNQSRTRGELLQEMPAAGLLVFYAWPLGTLLARVVAPHSVADALHAPGLGRVLWFTLWQAAAGDWR